MGRVASKRKIKQCDPFFKGERTLVKNHNSKYDLEPKSGPSKRKKKRMRRAIDEDRLEREVLGTSSSTPTLKYVKPDFESRKPGESYNQFCKRLKGQVQQVIIQETKKSSRQNEKRNK